MTMSELARDNAELLNSFGGDKVKSKKEAVYDEHISPLMAEIIKLCKEHRINMVADFSLGPDPNNDDEPLYCTTALPLDETEGHGIERVNDSVRGVFRRQPVMLAETHIGNRISIRRVTP